MADRTSPRKLRIACVLDQQVGLKSHALNLMKGLSGHPRVDATLIPVEYGNGDHWLFRVPGLPGGIAGTLCARGEIERGIAALGDIDAVLWGTWAAKSVPHIVERFPAFFVMDMTPNQMADMGEPYGYTKARSGRFAAWKRRATERIYQHGTAFFPWSDWVGESLHRDWGVASEIIHTIPPGVDTTCFQPAPQPTAAHGQRGVVNVLFVGGDFERKGGPGLLAWAERNIEKVHLTVVTRDEIRETPANVTVRHGIGPNSPELIALYQSSHIFALPTVGDCYSMVGMEAMACGVPVVISDIGGIRDIIADGQTGYLCKPGDTAAFAAKLDVLVADTALRARMAAAARERALAQFDASACARRLGDIVAQSLASTSVLPNAA
jgi:hypothetical protein